jgi:hypothetical protein
MMTWLIYSPTHQPTNKLIKIEAIVKTETMLAFRAFTKQELESVFSIGIE